MKMILFLLLLSFVFALPFVPRDVVDPPITSPTAGTVWQVGQTQTVSWNATGLPVNQTNPVGMLVLGYWYNNSENLDLSKYNPLATNISYSVGHIDIMVPNVPSRTDYIVVLFGDSGNASPQFTIINGASSSTSVAPSPVTTTPGSPPATPTATSNPGSPNNVGGGSSQTPTNGPSPTTNSAPTATSPSTLSSTVHSSTVVTVTASASPSSTQSSGAWQKHTPGLYTSLSISLALIFVAIS